MNGEFSGGGQGVATFYWTAHGVSPVITSFFRSSVQNNDHQGEGRHEVWLRETMFSALALCMNFVLVFAPSPHPPPHPLQQFNGPSVSMQHVSHKHSFGVFPKNNRIHRSCMIYRS